MATTKSFERTMTKSSPKCVTIPAAFVRKYGKEMSPDGGLVMQGDNEISNLKINVYMMKAHPHVSFGLGWKEFMRKNLIVEGDRIQFRLFPKSIFKVKRVRPNGVPVRDIRESASFAGNRESPSVAELIRVNRPRRSSISGRDIRESPSFVDNLESPLVAELIQGKRARRSRISGRELRESPSFVDILESPFVEKLVRAKRVTRNNSCVRDFRESSSNVRIRDSPSVTQLLRNKKNPT